MLGAAHRGARGPPLITCTRRRFLKATISQIHAQPPHAQKVSSVSTACKAWFGPVTTTVVGMDTGYVGIGWGEMGIDVGADRWCAVQSRPSK